MKLVAAAVMGILAVFSQHPTLAQDQAAAAAETETDSASTEEGENGDASALNVSKVAPSQLRQNFNPDRTEAWGDLGTGSNFVCFC